VRFALAVPAPLNVGRRLDYQRRLNGQAQQVSTTDHLGAARGDIPELNVILGVMVASGG
jgi:hypothetical protein